MTEQVNETSEKSLDEIIAEYQATTGPEKTVETKPEQEITPEQANVTADLTRQLKETTERLNKLEQWTQGSQVEADIKKAVSRVNKELQADPEYVEFQLEKTAKEKPGFKVIWENRKTNPKAWDNALDALAHELDGKIPRIDTELKETQKAVKSTQQAPSKSDDGESLGDTPEERQRNWQRMIMGS